MSVRPDLAGRPGNALTLRPLKPLDSPLVFTTTFDFDEYGRMKSLTYPDGEKVTYGYDRGGLLKTATGERPATVRYPAATETYLKSMVYDEYGQRRQVQLGNGAVTKYSYYPENHRLATVATTAAGRKLQDLVYAYDLVGNVTDEVNRLGVSTTSRSGQVTYTFQYDALDRLKKSTGVADARPGVTDQFTATYGYSNIHNMTANRQVHTVTTVTDLGTDIAYPPHTNHDFTYTYGGAGPHQATQIGETFLKYDGNGNTTSECRDHGDPTCTVNRDHFRELKWTEDNRLSSVVDGGGKSVTRFVYDASGERLVKYGNGGASITVGQFFGLKGRTAATKHIFAGTMRLASKLLPPTADWAPTSVTYTSTVATSTPSGGGPGNDNGCVPSDYQPQKCPILVDGEPVVPYPFQDTKVRPETYYYHPDHLGSTSWVTDQNGKVHEHVDYFPYGEVWREPKSDRDGAGVKGQRFLFSGKELDEETGLYYFGARYYDPVRVRWESADPLDRTEGHQPLGANPYQYASWSPVMFVDPDGREEHKTGLEGTPLVFGAKTNFLDWNKKMSERLAQSPLSTPASNARSWITLDPKTEGLMGNGMNDRVHGSKDYYDCAASDHWGKGHPAVDASAPNGATVLSLQRGVIMDVVLPNPNYPGGAIITMNSDSSVSIYGHAGILSGLRVGDAVDAGQPIGRVGALNHVHFEQLQMQPTGRLVRTDPMPMLLDLRQKAGPMPLLLGPPFRP